MKVIFLDFDGVLITREYHIIGEDGCTPYPHEYLINKLHQLIEKTGAQIVVSSSWRLYFTDEELSKIINHPVIGQTIHDYPKYKSRGEEIAHYLREHRDIDNYVIVDDEDDMLKEQAYHFVHCKNHEGLTDEKIEEAIKILED